MSEQIKTNRPYPIQLKLRDGHNAVIRVRWNPATSTK